MNEADIKKCIKNGYVWTSDGDKPEKVEQAGFTEEGVYEHYLYDPKVAKNSHATKREAQLAIATRREQARVDARKANGTQVPADPEPPSQTAKE